MPQHWRVIVLLSLVTGVAYLVRADVAVAQERMVPAVGLTMIGMGAITAWGFQLSYALFQVPAGMFGERFGAAAAPLLMAPTLRSSAGARSSCSAVSSRASPRSHG
jgi:sugar phosphate permease